MSLLLGWGGALLLWGDDAVNHSPAVPPWHVKLPNTTPGDPYEDDPTCCRGIVDAGGDYVVETDSGYYPPSLSDAYLMAAAPELLAACEAALPHVENYLQGMPELADQLRAAIAKARSL